MQGKDIPLSKIEKESRAEQYFFIAKSLGEFYYMYNSRQDCMTIFLKEIKSRDSDLIFPDYCKKKVWKRYIYEMDVGKYTAFFEKIQSGVHSGYVDIRCDTGSGYAWYRVSGISVPDQNGKTAEIVGRITDVTFEKNERDVLEKRAKIDAMTDLLNKVCFETECERILAESGPQERFALLVIDINGLKTFNDNFGHLFGDRVIKIVASALSSLFQNEGIIGRIGGDEFAVLIRCSEKAYVIKKIEALSQRIKYQQQEKENSAIVSVSTGTAYFNEDGLTYKELFLKADREMYFTKGKKIIPLGQDSI